MVKGTPKFDALAVGEGSFNILGKNIELTVKVAFVASTTGQTHGWTKCSTGWSKETFDALNALRSSMEQDLAKVHLTDGYDPLETPEPSKTADAPGGLLEHLQDDAAPQL